MLYHKNTEGSMKIMKNRLIVLIIAFCIFFGTIVSADSGLFTDVAISSWYKNAVSFVAEKGIMIGDQGKFRPDDYVTRAEMATIISKIYKDVESTEDKIINTIPTLLNNTVIICSENLYGSGVILNNNLILTANHVAIIDKVNISTYRNKKLEGVVIKRDVNDDLALIKFTSNIKFDKIALAERAQIGQTILSIGNPLGLNFNIIKGIICHTARYVKENDEYKNYMQININVNPGDSGGGIFDINGDLIGIIVKKICENEIKGYGYAIPYYRIKGFLGDDYIE